jgi:hypothetical protein
MFKFNFIPSSSSDELDTSIVPSDTNTVPYDYSSNASPQVHFLKLDSLDFPSTLSAKSNDGNVLFSTEYIGDPSTDPYSSAEDPLSLDYLKRVHICSKSADSFLLHHTLPQSTMNLSPRPNPKVLDVVPGIYEGGMKVWECSYDLCRYLREQLECSRTDTHSSLFRCQSFLELGCGHGLPTCFLLRLFRLHPHIFGNKRPTFVLSDYNDFVLKEVTWSNLILNVRSSPIYHSRESFDSERDFLSHLVYLVSGDWSHLSQYLSSMDPNSNPSEMSMSYPFPLTTGRLDCILASETLYTKASTRETAEFLVNHLQVETGVALIATKRYYFGVGGGTDEFLAVLETQRCTLRGKMWRPRVERIQEFNQGTVRDLLQVQLVMM